VRGDDEGFGASGEGLRMKGRGCGGTAGHSKGDAHTPWTTCTSGTPFKLTENGQ
jgi:hypothetical protein